MPATLLEWAEFGSYTVTILGVAVAAIVFPWNAAKRRRNEEKELVEGANEPFRRFLELQIEHPALGLQAGCMRDVVDSLSPQERIQQRVLVEYLVSVLETAYYVSAGGQEELSEWRVWTNWFVRGYARNPNFRRRWAEIEADGLAAFGDKFLDWLRAKLKEIDRAAAAS